MKVRFQLAAFANTNIAHCLVTGKMNQRTSAVDGLSYAIGFEMRLPNDWNGRFFCQANGGIDGSVGTATGGVNGGVNGGGSLNNALNQGFAVISSDAGHVGSQGPTFGLDPQARLDYGYNAAAGGPSTDQFDMLTPLVAWVERGTAPDSVLASARGVGNAAGANADVPTTWAAGRTRPLCPYPKVAKYKGSGDIELADSFSCQ